MAHFVSLLCWLLFLFLFRFGIPLPSTAMQHIADFISAKIMLAAWHRAMRRPKNPAFRHRSECIHSGGVTQSIDRRAKSLAGLDRFFRFTGSRTKIVA